MDASYAAGDSGGSPDDSGRSKKKPGINITGDPLLSLPTVEEESMFARAQGRKLTANLDGKTKKNQEGEEGAGPKTPSATNFERMMDQYGMTPKKFNLTEFEYDAEVRDLRYEWSGWRLWCLEMSHNAWFNRFFNFAIMANTITMGIEADGYAGAADAMLVIENIFVVLFLAEVTIRVSGSPKKPWMDKFMMLDIFIVAISVVDNWFLEPARNAGQITGVDLSCLSTLRILRLVRIVRIFRLIGFVKPLRVLIQSLADSVQNLFWIAVLLIGVMYFFSLMFRTLLTSVIDQENHPLDSMIEEYFGSVLVTMLTLFEVLTGGIQWSKEIARPLLAHEETAGTGLLWIVYVVCALLCLANVITGLFVESLHTTAEADDKQVELEKFVTTEIDVPRIKQIFKEFDLDEDGSISRAEFKAGLAARPEIAELLGITLEECELLFKELQSEKDRVVIDDFLFGIVKLKGGTKSVDSMALDFQLKKVITEVRKIKNIEKEVEGNILDEMKHPERSEWAMELFNRIGRIEEALERNHNGKKFSSREERVPGRKEEEVPNVATLRESFQLRNAMEALMQKLETCTPQQSLAGSSQPVSSASTIAPQQSLAGSSQPVSSASTIARHDSWRETNNLPEWTAAHRPQVHTKISQGMMNSKTPMGKGHSNILPLDFTQIHMAASTDEGEAKELPRASAATKRCSPSNKTSEVRRSSDHLRGTMLPSSALSIGQEDGGRPLRASVLSKGQEEGGRPLRGQVNPDRVGELPPQLDDVPLWS